MAVKVDASGVINAFNRLPGLIERGARIAVKEWLTSVQIDARQHHRFTTRSAHGLEASVQVEIKPNVAGSNVYLDLGIANYGPFIHDGFKSWQADQFLFQAADRQKAELPKNIQKSIHRAIAQVGLS